MIGIRRNLRIRFLQRKMADKVGGKSKVRSSTRKGTACSASKNATTKQVFHCRICQDVINEPNESDGDDSVHCNGLCDGWIHRRCAGLSLARFEEISKSDDPFFCPSCCAVRNQTEIDLLKSALASLTSEVSTLKAAFDQIMLQRVNSPNPIKDKPTTPEQLRGTLPSPNATSPKPPASTKSDTDNPDKKFNLVIYGISESTNGTQRSKRIASDFQAVVSALKPLNNELSDNSIRDCVRLGKYTSNNNRPRPMLVKFINSRCVSTILANRTKLASTKLAIKPHMSPLEREVESILLKERRKLINNNTPTKHIQIRKNQLLLSGQLHAKVTITANNHCQLDYIVHGEVVSSSPQVISSNPPAHDPTLNPSTPQ